MRITSLNPTGAYSIGSFVDNRLRYGIKHQYLSPRQAGPGPFMFASRSRFAMAIVHLAPNGTAGFTRA
jgi:hypothetical protein